MVFFSMCSKRTPWCSYWLCQLLPKKLFLVWWFVCPDSECTGTQDSWVPVHSDDNFWYGLCTVLSRQRTSWSLPSLFVPDTALLAKPTHSPTWKSAKSFPILYIYMTQICCLYIYYIIPRHKFLLGWPKLHISTKIIENFSELRLRRRSRPIFSR